jgi:hypothetical protein
MTIERDTNKREYWTPENQALIRAEVAARGGELETIDPRLTAKDQIIDEPIEAPAIAITDEQRRLIEEDPFKPSNLLSDGGYVIHEEYDAAAENDLGAALMGLIQRALQSEDKYLRDNASHVQQLMAMALDQSKMMAQQ